MFSWKERLYALLLRRILGPLLSTESHDDLLSYINIQRVSLTEGSYIFNNVSFNTEYIASQFLNNSITIVRFTIRTIQIDIRLVEEEVEEINTNSTTTKTSRYSSNSTNTSSKGNNASNTSLAWRALKYGIKTASNVTAAMENKQPPPSKENDDDDESPPPPSTQPAQPSTTGVSLVVHVRFEGIAIVIEPSTNKTTTATEPASSSSSSPSTINHSNVTTSAPHKYNYNESTTTTTSDTITTTRKKSATFLSSFLEAVLASLRLSIELHDVRIRMQHGNGDHDDPRQQQRSPHTKKFIEIHTQSILYYDPLTPLINHQPKTTLSTTVNAQQQQPQQSSTDYETVQNKVLDVTRITLLTGTTHDTDHESDPHAIESMVSIVALLDGTSRICYRVVQYYNTDDTIKNLQNMPKDTTTKNSETKTTTISPNLPYTQQDIQVSLHHKFNISVDIVSLQVIRAVVHGFTTYHPESSNRVVVDSPSASVLFAHQWVEQHHQYHHHHHPTTTTTKTSAPETIRDLDKYPLDSNRNDDYNDNDETDCQIIETMMAQYREARLLVERKEIRGGILVPSIEVNGQVTFDTFFDANESILTQSHRHSSMLKESILGSMLLFSTTGSNKQQPTSDWIHRKFSLYLQEGGIKLTLPSSSENTRWQQFSAREYVLLTFNDINLSVHMSTRSSNYTLTMNHIEIEDASFVHNKPSDVHDDDDDEYPPVTEVGTMLRFVQDGNVEDDDDDINLLVQAPCLSMSVQIITNDNKSESMDWDIVMEPIEVSYRDSMMTKLTAFFQVDTKNNPPILEKPKHSTISVTATCASITLYVPLRCNGDDISPRVYNRAGYISETTMLRESALGLVCERLTVELRQNNFKDTTNEVTVAYDNMIVFLSTPVSPYSAFDHRIRRLDLISICGRTEINPCIPITINCKRFSTLGSSSDPNVDGGRILAESLFPIVPSLSSYKARQEDDDDETTSKATDLDVKLSDPQSAMLLNLTNANLVVSIHVPVVVIDVSAPELLEIEKFIRYADVESKPKATITAKSRNDLCLACSLTSETVSLYLHADNNQSNESTFVLALEDIKAHCVVDQATPKHLRWLVHDVDFLEIVSPLQNRIPTTPSSARERARTLQTSASCRADYTVHPILYRSSLFVPISPSSPSIHLDLFMNSDDNPCSPTTTAYLNLFHFTYRHQYDCAWVTRLVSAIPRKPPSTTTVDHTSLMRLLITVMDCNFDYLTPQIFPTPARLILRMGEMRLSSNLVSPTPLKQAYTCSIANSEVLLCCTRFAYNFENGRLVSSLDVMKPADISMHVIGLPDEAGFNDVLRLMNYRTMTTVESINMHIVLSHGDQATPEPAISMNVSTRQICIFACRDSLARLLDTIGEASAEMTAISAETFDELRQKSLKTAGSGVSIPVQNYSKKKDIALIQRKVTNISSNDVPFEFLLDGYDWTAIDSDEIGKIEIPQGEEQSARWFVDGEIQCSDTNESEIAIFHDGTTAKKSPIQKASPIITHHFNLHPVADPIGDGDMGAAKYANAKCKPIVQARVIVRDLAIRLRFFDGYDWPELLSAKARAAPRSEAFIIPELKKKIDGEGSSDARTSPPDFKDKAERNKKSLLLENLLIDGNKIGSTFADIPLPDEHVIRLKEQAELRRLARRTSKYFQIEMSGVVARIDSMKDCEEHRLVSCVNVMINDLFLAESISSDKPVKMLGEWFNDQEHPRDSKEGLILMKMVTWHPVNRITPDDKVANDESDVCLKMHPLRCIIDQRAVAFIRAFFNTDNDYGDLPNITGHELPPHLHAVPPPLFTTFRVQPLKLKVDYRPQKLDTSALRNGAVVELINLSPLDAMVLTLKSVNIENEVGFGAAMSLVVRRWVEDICATQLHKFVTKSRPFEPITEVGAAATDIIVLPWEAFRNNESVTKAIKAGAKSFSKVAMYELLNTSSRVANFVGANVSRVSEISSQSRRTGGNLLPDRPVQVPRTIFETGPHALESLSRGLQEANYTIVIVPYREYHRSGATGAAYSVMRGIPVAIAAPTSGAAEALSYALLGARNQIRPDIRKEDEVTNRGLQHPH